MLGFAGVFSQNIQLRAPVAPQQAQMRSHEAQACADAQIDLNRPPGFDPRQVDVVNAEHSKGAAHQDRVAMPAEADPVLGHVDHPIIGFGFDHPVD